jgi:hypothetical protein
MKNQLTDVPAISETWYESCVNFGSGGGSILQDGSVYRGFKGSTDLVVLNVCGVAMLPSISSFLKL